MKSTVFLKPLEYSIITNGEKWNQGDKITGALTILNHGTEDLKILDLQINLAYGNSKKVKAKDSKAWDLISQLNLGLNLSIVASDELTFPWEFTIPQDCPTSDKNGGIYLTFSDLKNIWPSGFLQIVIGPKLVLLQFLEIFENFLKFKIIQTRFSNGMFEVKLKPPGSRELSYLETLVLRMKEVDKTLSLEYIFNMNVFETVSGNVLLQKKTKQIDQQLTSKEYYIYGESPNFEFIKSSIESIIKQAIPKIM